MTMDSDAARSFWERPELVERFAGREPDVRLMELLDAWDDPGRVSVLDLGCAGGRNAVPLAERGFDLFALDASRAMVERTRARVASILGEKEAARRVRVGRMEELDRFADGRFDLVVGLGVYHQAPAFEAWRRAFRETVRVLRPGGLLLYASFHPETAPDGTPGEPVPGRPHLYDGFRSGVLTLVDADELEGELRRVGLDSETPSETVRVETEKGVRVTVNGLFRRVGG